MVIVSSNYKAKTQLKVKLDFKKYAEENNCVEKIKDRLTTYRYPMMAPLSDYLGLEEGLEIRRREDIFSKKIRCNKESLFDNGIEFGYPIRKGKYRKFSIKTSKKNLTLKMKIISPKNLSPDELLNVKNLEHFIETGEYPKDGVLEKQKKSYCEEETE